MQANFFETIRLLERNTLKGLPAPQRRLNAIGLDVLPEQEKLRFKANYELSFSPTSIHNAGNLNNDHYQTLIVNFLQLMGAEGTLPQHYTKLVIERIKQKDYAMADFIDMFHHRLISLYYRAWTKYRLVHQNENHGVDSDPITNLIDALSAIQDHHRSSQRYYSGHFSKNVRSASALEALLADYLQQTVKVQQHVGSWLNLDKQSLSKLTTQGNDRSQLGQGVLIGKRAWSVQSKIAIHIKDLSLAQYETIMPGTDKYLALKELVRSYTPHHISIDLFFYVAIEQSRIGFRNKPQLSKNAWLYAQPQQTLKAKTNIQ